MKGTIEASVPNAIDELKNSVKEKSRTLHRSRFAQKRLEYGCRLGEIR
jgi:hypothetical protein